MKKYRKLFDTKIYNGECHFCLKIVPHRTAYIHEQDGNKLNAWRRSYSEHTHFFCDEGCANLFILQDLCK